MSSGQRLSPKALLNRPELPKWLLWGIGLCLVVVALFVGLDTAATRAFAGNSDGATVVLEGVALRHGHLLLGGWDLSFDSFWALDATVYAVASVIVGFRGDLFAVGPALIALAIIVVGVGVVARGRRPQVAVVAALVVIAVLGLPSPVLAFFLLQGPWHVGTALWCLVAFVGLRHRRFGLGWAVAVIALTAATLSDLSSITLGLIPCVIVGLVAMARNRSLKSGASTVVAPVAAVLLATGVRALTVRIGTYSIAHGITKAKSSEYPANIKLVIRWGAGLLGLGKVPIGPSAALGPYEQLPVGTLEHAFRAPVLAIVVFAVCFAAVSTLIGIVRGTSLLDLDASRSHVNDLLLVAAAGSAGLFCVLTPNGNGDYARYLTPAVIFASILAASVTGQILARLSDERVLNVVLAAAVLFAAVGVAGYRRELTRPPAPQTADALGSFLEAHDLKVGIGDYWSSSVVTVLTGGKVAVRPVIPNRAAVLVRYGRQSDVEWYKGVRFNFLVFDTGRPWRNVNTETAENMLGKPSEQFTVGTYVVLVWSKGFAISPVGYTRG